MRREGGESIIHMISLQYTGSMQEGIVQVKLGVGSKADGSSPNSLHRTRSLLLLEHFQRVDLLLRGSGLLIAASFLVDLDQRFVR